MWRTWAWIGKVPSIGGAVAIPHTGTLVRFVQSRLEGCRDPEKAGPMAAYLKTDMPFYGVQTPERRTVERELNRRFAPATRDDYEAAVDALWRLPHREEKYVAIAYACHAKRFVTVESMPLYEKMIREGAWWDLVDAVAPGLVGVVLLRERDRVRPLIEEWIDDDDLWIRRAAILSQLRHKDQTNAEQLFEHCLRRAREEEFFIRKAIGWALREYSKCNPMAVRDFLLSHRDRLSRLSFREGAKWLVREGLVSP